MVRLSVSISIFCLAAFLPTMSAQANPQPGLAAHPPALISENINIAQSGSVGGRAGRGRKDLSGGGKPRKKR